jgi:hypothetical protein
VSIHAKDRPAPAPSPGARGLLLADAGIHGTGSLEGLEFSLGGLGRSEAELVLVVGQTTQATLRF